MISAPVVVATIAAVLPHAVALGIYDSILRNQYELAHDVWVKRGREIGYNWAPSGATVVDRFFRIPGKQSREWLFRTPDWAVPHAHVVRLFRVFRALEGLFILQLIGWLVVWIVASL
jgi:hypothetical protein